METSQPSKLAFNMKKSPEHNTERKEVIERIHTVWCQLHNTLKIKNMYCLWLNKCAVKVQHMCGNNVHKSIKYGKMLTNI